MRNVEIIGSGLYRIARTITAQAADGSSGRRITVSGNFSPAINTYIARLLNSVCNSRNQDCWPDLSGNKGVFDPREFDFLNGYACSDGVLTARSDDGRASRYVSAHVQLYRRLTAATNRVSMA